MDIEKPQEKFRSAEWFHISPASLPPASTGYRVHTAFGAFGNYKSERAAAYLLKFFQERKTGWSRFTLREFLKSVGTYPSGTKALRVEDLDYYTVDISELYGLYILPCGILPGVEDLYLDWPLLVSTEFVERLQQAEWTSHTNYYW